MMLYIMQCNIKMKYLWLGNAVLENDLNIMINKGYKSTSSQVSQWNLINGLEITRQCIFDIISGSVIPHYPSYEDIILHEKKWQHKTGADDYSIGFLNIKYINKLICQYNMIAMAKQWYKKHNDEGEIVIFVYSMRSPVMAAAYAIKKMCSNAKILLIIPDLPEYMDVSESFLKKCLKRIDAIQQKKFLKTFDGYLVYAETMIDYLSLDKNRCLLMEGSISIDECALPPIESGSNYKKKGSIVIMYSGNVSKNFGIPMLLEAFDRIHDNRYELWITGIGNASQIVQEMCKKNGRIKYYGFVEKREDLRRIQINADAFISMRLPSERISSFSFPSKLFEYMALGKPVISFDNKGIPNEYWKYLIKINEENVDSLYNALVEVGSMTNAQRIERGKQSRDFIINNKNNLNQSYRIWKFLEKLQGETI